MPQILTLKLRELRKLSNFCRKNGIIYYKSGNLEFRISTKALNLPTTKIDKDEAPVEGLGKDSSNIDLLLWSSTPVGMPEDAFTDMASAR